MNIPILVIVGQKKDSVKKWLEKNPMPFPILIDEKRYVIKAFDVYQPLGLDAFNIAHPSLFLISEDGTIVYSYISKNQFDRPTQQDTYKKVHHLLSKSIIEEETEG